MKKKDYIYCGINIMVVTIIIIVLTRFGHYFYGSKVDWNTQHYSLPEYFRMRFYESGQLFPNFEMNLGGGQNIYNFSYYGLFSPIVLFSYLLPFVSMRTYIMVTSILAVYASIFLMYVWLKKKYSTNVCALVTFFFSMATPLTFHSHRHIMFMNYMPFLILALIGVDRYVEKKKRITLIISAFLMILTSYFFSVGGMFVIGIYSIYRYLEENDKFIFKDFCKKIGCIVGYLMISVLMSAILIVPTFASLLNGRSETNINIDLKQLLLPSYNVDFVLYQNYAMGLTAIFVLAILYMIYAKKRQDRFLGIVFLCIIMFPIFIYILNATMYVDAKVLIPFVPLGMIPIAKYFKDFVEDKIFNENNEKKDNIKILIIQVGVCVVSILLTLSKGDIFKAYIVDILITVVFLVLYYFFRKKLIFIIPCMIVAVVTCISSNFVDKFERNSAKNEQLNNNIKKAADYIETLQNEDDSLYRTFIDSNRVHTFNTVFNPKIYTTSMYSSICDKGYNDFYFQKFGVENPHRNAAIVSWGKNMMLNTFMSDKYVIMDKCELNGYKEKKRFSDDVCVYENENVYPIGYASSSIMSKKQFDKLKYPYSNDALLNHIVVDKDIDEIDFKKNAKEYKDYTIEKRDDLLEATKLKDKDGYRIKVDNNPEVDYESADDIYADVRLNFKNTIKDKLIIVTFNVNNTIARRTYKKSDGDVIIDICDVRNKLTTPSWKYYNKNEEFQYVLSNKKYNHIDIKFGFGEYEISDFKVYTIDYDILKENRKKLDEYYITDIKKDTIDGNIDVKEDGYFRMSIPYDKGFEVQVDGKKVETQKVDETFIGFPINKGKHNITFTYFAPFSNIAKIMSILGVVLLIVSVCYEKVFKKI